MRICIFVEFKSVPNIDLPQVDLFLFITLERSEKVISSDEVARAIASEVSGERSTFPRAKPTG